MENLKDRFIVSERIDEKQVTGFIERSLAFCRVTTSGGVIIDENRLSNLEKVKISLVARFLANKLDSNISPEVNGDELSSYLMIQKDQVMARLKDAKDEKFATRAGKGVYSANPFRIEEFLSALENKYKVRKAVGKKDR